MKDFRIARKKTNLAYAVFHDPETYNDLRLTPLGRVREAWGKQILVDPRGDHRNLGFIGVLLADLTQPIKNLDNMFRYSLEWMYS